MKIHSYPKIWNVGHKALRQDGRMNRRSFEDLDLVVDIEEKVDGSQFSAMIDEEGNVHMRSKGAEIHADAPEKMFTKAVEAIGQIKHCMVREWEYVFEYLRSSKHNTLQYEREPRLNLVLLDIKRWEEDYLSYIEKEAEGRDVLGVDVTQRLYQGKYSEVTEEMMQEFLAQPSILGGKMEGVVIKPWPRDLFGPDGKALMAKYVSPAFREVHEKAWKKSNPGGKDIIQQIIERVGTQERWEKAFQHLRDDGKLSGEGRDIGLLIKEVSSDIDTELRGEIAEALLRWAMPKILRGSVAGLAEWYRDGKMGEV